MSTQANTMQDRVGPHITNLIEYVASVDLILRSNMAKDKKASITKKLQISTFPILFSMK